MSGFPTAGGGFLYTNGDITDVPLFALATPIAITAAATLTAVQLTNGLMTATTVGAANLQLPTVTSLNSEVPNSFPNSAFTLIVINTDAADAVTFTTNTGWTLVGNMVVALGTSAQFIARQTAIDTWTWYRSA